MERRLVVGYDEIAPDLRMAIIAAEDGDFNSHFGLSISRIAVTLSRDVFEFVTDRIRGRTSRPAGASTLTQQLARIVLPEAVGFYEGEISLERKIREAIVAIQIEKRYTKREILTMFANQMYWGTTPTALRPLHACTSRNRRKTSRSKKPRCSPASSRATCGRARM